MRYFELAGTKASRLAQGCMRIGGLAPADLDRLIKTDLECGINFFDHADIYGGGRCEEVFGDFLAANPGMREKMLIQTKCGIRRGMYDFSKEHILEALDGSLKRLKTDYVDFLLLHRPDALVEPEEVAEAFDILRSSGKVLNFGVSNQDPMQMELLSQALGEGTIKINQLQLSLTESGMIDAGINVNMKNEAGINRDGMVLNYCRLKGITIQPWSPFQHGFFKGAYIGNPEFAELNRVLDEVAETHGITPTGVVIAWLLSHPACMQPISGSTTPSRSAEMAKAADVILSREEWYRLYLAAGKKLP